MSTETSSAETRLRVIDTDVHPELPELAEWMDFLPAVWRDYVDRLGVPLPPVPHLNPHGVIRRDAFTEEGVSMAVDPELTRLHHLQAYGIDIGVLVPTAGLSTSAMTNPEFSTALCVGINNYFKARWLSGHTCYRGSIVVSTRDIAAAVQEVERWAGDPAFVQVAIGGGQPMLLGERFYYPLFEACARHGLPLALHPGQEGAGITPPPSGFYACRYIEWHTSLALGFQAHLTSVICEGVFERYPEFRLTLLEGGVSWLAPWIWRLDKNWKALRVEVPWLKQKPSAYLANHVRLSTQPIEEPAEHKHLVQLFSMFDAERLLMFSSDFPHWDGDTPAFALRGFSEDFKRRVLAENAEAWYGLA
jgi:predicted TIM-barrel fold metal-dependent hydrolase